MLAEELRPELDVSGLVDTVDVTETGSDREVRGDGVKGRVDIPDVLGLGVERVVVDRGVVNTVLLTTGDTDFHFEPDWKYVNHLKAWSDTKNLRLILAIRLK